MKRLLTVIIVTALILTSFSATATPAVTNLLMTHLSGKSGVLMNASTGTVSANDRFNSNGALATVNDGDEATRTDVYGALDWNPAQYVGVLFSLDDICYAQDVEIISGYQNLADTYRVYASENIADLYTSANIVANEIVCSGTAQTAVIGKSVQYVAVFGIAYNGNLRIAEIKVNGYPVPGNPNIPTAADYAAGLSVDGNKLKIGDKKVALQGANIPHFSWSVYGDGNDANVALNDAINTLGCKIVRLAVNPDFYLNGGTSKNVTRTAEQYRALIDNFVVQLTSARIAVVLDCHAYSGAYDTVVGFWDIAAQTYDSNEMVMFDLVNEPISSWQVWYEGGDITLPDGNNTQTTSIGMPALIDRIRTVSDNVVVLGGINWAYDLSGISESSFEQLASTRAQALGMTAEQYSAAYSVRTPERQGRGIMLSTHIYGNDDRKFQSDWLASFGEVKNDFPILIGEYNPYYRNGQIDALNEREIAFFQKIFRTITENGFSSTAWALGAEPYLSDNHGNLTALGVAVGDFIANGKCNFEQAENVLYSRFSAAYPIAQHKTSGNITSNNGFINQAHSGGDSVGNNIIFLLIDGETSTHYDIYSYDDYYLGMVYVLNSTCPCYSISMVSGFAGYPDKYRIYASDNVTTLFSSENRIDNFNTVFAGDTVTFDIDRSVKYVAFLAEGYVRIKEVILQGTVFGDINKDGAINGEFDMPLLREAILGEEIGFTSACDVNSNGSIDVIDLIALKKRIIK